MTTARLWYQGARPKTLGAAISPVLVGTAAGSLDGPIDHDAVMCSHAAHESFAPDLA